MARCIPRWGSAQPPPAGPGKARPPNAFWRILPKFAPFWVSYAALFLKITDTLSHNIISHKRDKPITRVVSKYRIQMESIGLQ